MMSFKLVQAALKHLTALQVELVFNLKNARTQKHSKKPHMIITQQPLISVLWTIADRSFPQIKTRDI